MKKAKRAVFISVIVVMATLVVGFWGVIMRFLGHRSAIERYVIKRDIEARLEKKYPNHSFNVKVENVGSEIGYSLRMTATDEEGLEFWIEGLGDDFEDHYHDKWNTVHYGKELVKYQNELRDRYFKDIPYVGSYEYYRFDTYMFYRGPFKEKFFESMEDAIEGSKYCTFETQVTFTGIDLDTADDEELQKFAESIADSLIYLHKETGYYEVRIGDFSYWEYDEKNDKHTSRDELVERIIKSVELSRKIKKNKEK